MGVEPWPAEGDAAAYGCAFFVYGFFAGEDDWLLVCGCVAGEVCAVESDGGGSVGV